eukprot:747745-Hanusia_phi.AAC.5
MMYSDPMMFGQPVLTATPPGIAVQMAPPTPTMATYDNTKLDYLRLELNRKFRAGFVFLFSFMVLLVGTGYTTMNSQGNLNGSSTYYPMAIILTCGLCLIFEGLLGLIISGMELMAHKRSASATMLLLAIQVLFGLFILASLMIGQYAFMADKNSQDVAKQFSMLSMLSMLALFIALLGGFFCFTMSLHNLYKNEKVDPERSVASRKTKVLFYSFLVVLKGCSELAIGELARQNGTPGSSAPFIIFRPNLVLSDGVLTLVVGLIGMAIGAAGLFKLKNLFTALSFFSFIIQLALYILGQFGANSSAGMSSGMTFVSLFGAGDAAALSVMLIPFTTALMFMPAWAASEENLEQQITQYQGKDGLVFANQP